MTRISLILTIQGWFYVITGLWPVVNMKSFEMITGVKKEKWPVKIVGLMITCSGVIFLLYNTSEVALILAIINALVLAAADTYYSLLRVIPKVYLLDAAVEVLFVVIYLFLK